MDAHLLIKIIHMCGAALIIFVILARASTLFKGTQGNLPNPAGRKFFTALQHATVTLLVLTGVVLLFMKHFEVQPWFYAKVVLFLVMLSSLAKAYKKEDTALLMQRRAGLFIAAISLIFIITLVIIKPVFG